jgi:hypothetical protein
MTLSKSLLLIPAASLLIAAAIGAGACSSSVSITTSTPPGHIDLPANVTIGGACSDQVYFADDSGYVFCNGDQWAYTTTEPGDGYSEDSQYASYASDTFDSADTDTEGSESNDTYTSNSDTNGSDTDTSNSDTNNTDTQGSDTQGSDTSSGQQQG